jgi:hypothetical protein
MQPWRKLARRDCLRRTWAAGRTGQDGSGLVPPAGARLEPGRELKARDLPVFGPVVR